MRAVPTLFLALVLPMTSPTGATTGGNVVGVVLDAARKPVAGATVVIEGDRGTQQVVTDTEGRFRWSTPYTGVYLFETRIDGWVIGSRSLELEQEIVAHVELIVDTGAISLHWNALRLPEATEDIALSYPRKGTYVVLDFRRFCDGVDELKVFGDGRVHRLRSWSSANSDHSEIWLSPDQLDRILQFIVSRGVLDLNTSELENEVRKERMVLAETHGRLHVTSGRSRELLVIRIDEVHARGRFETDVERLVEFSATASLARQFPENESLRNLAAVFDILSDLAFRTLSEYQ